jgi:hypothetical protein
MYSTVHVHTTYLGKPAGGGREKHRACAGFPIGRYQGTETFPHHSVRSRGYGWRHSRDLPSFSPAVPSYSGDGMPKWLHFRDAVVDVSRSQVPYHGLLRTVVYRMCD